MFVGARMVGVSDFRLVVLLLFLVLLCWVGVGITLWFIIVVWFSRHIDVGFFWCYYL